jgi:signal transduction histidine kinase
MTGGSLRNRLLAAASVLIGSALLLYWFGLASVFERQLTRRIEAELTAHLAQLASAVRINSGGDVIVTRELADPRFNTPFRGLYWQVNEKREAVLRSPSLWDQTIELPAGPLAPREIRLHNPVPFYDGELIAVEQHVILGLSGGERSLHLVAAVDRSAVSNARQEFEAEVALLVGMLGLFLIIASGLQIFVGLRPLGMLRDRLETLRSGKAQRLEGTYPAEVQSLVDVLNALVEGRDRLVKDARARAGDLAHGLKTPLAILAAEGRKLESEGDTESAAEIARQVELMNRHVERQLARTRARNPGEPLKARMKLEPAVQRLVRTMHRLPRGDEIEWFVEIPGDIQIDFDPMDFDEVAGNFLDNARKWANERVIVSSLKNGEHLSIIFQDDGPGVPEAELANIVERGGRADQTTPGTGLGLAIASDILEIYGAELQIENAAPRGLRVRIQLST